MGNKSERLTKGQRNQIKTARREIKQRGDDFLELRGEMTRNLNSLNYETRRGAPVNAGSRPW